MAVCPRCGADLIGEFGMTQCPSCSGFSFIGDDGVARAPEDDPVVEHEAFVGVPTPETAADHEGFVAAERSSPRIETPEISEEPPFAFDPVPSSIIDVPQTPESGAGFGDFGMDAFAPMEPVSADGSGSGGGAGADGGGYFSEPPSAEQNADNYQSWDSTPASSDSDSVPAQEPEWNSAADSDSTSQSARTSDRSSEPRTSPEGERAEMDFGPASDPLNLNAFANSEVSSGRDGPLLFRVILQGIDTKEIREIIREVLNDDRFRLDSAAIMARVAKGNLVIDGLSPVKASILVTRIKKLPVSIRWEQYAITEAKT